MADASNLDELANAISSKSPAIKKSAQASAAVVQDHEARLRALEGASAPAPEPTPPPSGPETAAFIANWDDGNYDEFKDASGFAGWNLNKVTFVASDGAVRPRAGDTKMARFEVSKGDVPPWSASLNTVGFKKQPPIKTASGVRLDQLGSESYIGGSIYIPASFPWYPNMLFNIFQEWHGDNNYQAPFKLVGNMGNPPDITKARLAMELNTQYPGDHIVMDCGPMTDYYDRWVDFVAHHKWSTGADGLFEGWVGTAGSTLSKKFSRPGKTWQAGQSVVWFQPVYYRPDYEKTAIFYYGKLRIGPTYESVVPRP